MLQLPPYRLYAQGDHAVLIDFGQQIDMTINKWVMAIFHYTQQHPIEGILDIIPAYSSICFVYDTPLLYNKTGGSTVVEYVMKRVEENLAFIKIGENGKKNTIDVPVCYDVSLAPDLVSLAVIHRLTVEDVIRIHCSATYHVFMLGFLPGFAYMGTVNSSIATARHRQPRTVVPAGSVGIAGEQTGIYPVASPGGWQLIGQTPLRLFDPSKEQPCLFAPGDAVRFYPVSPAEFKKMNRHGDADH